MQKLNTWIRKVPIWIAIIAVLALQITNCFSNKAVNEQLTQVESQIKEVRAVAVDANNNNSEVNKAVGDKIEAITSELDNLKTQNQSQDKTLQTIEKKLKGLVSFGDF